MKAIQITVDEGLLSRLDADPDVKRHGRSGVIRRAVDEYLRQRRKRRIAEAYTHAYGSGGLGSEFDGWTDEGTWPGR
jgi:metal-responsive CopG/Arc/MetJ family transcriptional regulator